MREKGRGLWILQPCCPHSLYRCVMLLARALDATAQIIVGPGQTFGRAV